MSKVNPEKSREDAVKALTRQVEDLMSDPRQIALEQTALILCLLRRLGIRTNDQNWASFSQKDVVQAIQDLQEGAVRVLIETNTGNRIVTILERVEGGRRPIKTVFPVNPSAPSLPEVKAHTRRSQAAKEIFGDEGQ